VGDLRAEAEVVDVQLGIHTLQSRIVSLGAILARRFWGALLFVASYEAAEERYLPGFVVSRISVNPWLMQSDANRQSPFRAGGPREPTHACGV
jgi:hypothetical protein